MRIFRIISTAVIAALLCVNVFAGFSLIHLDNEFKKLTDGRVPRQVSAYVLPVAQADFLPALDVSAGDLSIDAKSALVIDVKTGRLLYQKNTDQQLPIASLTKIMTAIVVWENLEQNAVVTVKPTAVRVDGQRQELYKDENISISNLMQLLLIKSSNDAAYALRDYASEKGIDLIAKMNQKAQELFMTNSHFTDPAGLDDNAYSTAEDLAKEVTYALRYDAIWNASRQPTATIASVDGKYSHEVKSTDELLGVINDIIGGKTGYTDGALGCMILIVNVPKENDKLIGIVLGSKGRFEAMKEMVQWTQRAYRWQ